MRTANALVIVGGILFIGGIWFIAPMIHMYATSFVCWGRVLDTVVVPCGDGQVQFTAIYEYPHKDGDVHVLVQGTAQADMHLKISDAPMMSVAQAVQLQHSMQDMPRRRVFQPMNPDEHEAFIITEALSGAWKIRYAMTSAFLGSLLMSMGIIARGKIG